tara:strand:+ start:1704 stop:2999 length:1296 start_codon:yes stop_codon:yes gene_type:complete
MSETKIAIIGLGYVGLPLSIQFAHSGVAVLGLDIDQSKIDSINKGKSYIEHITSEKIKRHIRSGKLDASTDISRVVEVDAVLICVPTPLNKNREPDISYVLETGKCIAPYLQKGTLVVLESTTYPGTTDTDLRKVLEVGSGMKAGEGFYLAYSPEREDPGNPDCNVAIIPKVIGGYTEKCRVKAEGVYSQAIEKMVPVSSCRAAEAAKLLENIFRSINIALVNELKQIYAAMGIDIWEVIDAAKTKPFGFMPFYPGPGLGGHCIPIDPFYLTWKAREFNQQTRFIELAGEINISMPSYVLDRVAHGLNLKKLSINGSNILIMGLAYKPEIADDRESPSYEIMKLLKSCGANVSYYDPYIPVVLEKREYKDWTGTKSVTWSKSIISQYDLAIISTAHKKVNYTELFEWVPLIVDTRNAMKSIDPKLIKTIKC